MNEYYALAGQQSNMAGWQTRIASFKMPGSVIGQVVELEGGDRYRGTNMAIEVVQCVSTDLETQMQYVRKYGFSE